MRVALIHGGRVIDPVNGIDGIFDVRIASGKIAAIELPGSMADPGAEIVDARGCWVVPGLVDAHTHLRDPGFPQKETIFSGLHAAAAGGFVAVAAMANTAPVNDTPQVTRYMLERAHEVRGTHLIPVSAVTHGLEGRELVDMAAMADAGARLFSDDGVPIDNEELLAGALARCNALGVAVSLHEEDRTLAGEWAMNAGGTASRLELPGMPREAESARVRRDLEVARRTNAPLHIAHVSTAESIEAIRLARRNDVRVTCEIAPHHFSVDETAVLRWGSDAKVNPPLRARDEVEAMRAAIADGTIDMIATDHAPHDPASKSTAELASAFGAGVPHRALRDEERAAFSRAANGLVGLETALGLALAMVHRNEIGPARLVELMSVNPARLLGTGGGALDAGAAADITIIDPDIEWNVDPMRFFSKGRNTPYAGMRLRGRAMLTIVTGELVYDGRRDAR